MRRAIVVLGAGALFLALVAALWPTAPAAAVSAAVAPPASASISQTCSSMLPGRVTVTFAWPRAASDVSAIWVDLSLSGDEFSPGTFAGAGPLRGDATTLSWDGILGGGRLHYYRVNAFTGSGWRLLAMGSFASGECGSGIPALQPVQQECIPGDPYNRVRVTFAWTPNLHAGFQYLDLTLSNNGFAPGTFIGGPLAGGAASDRWDGLLPNALHYWRINDLVGGSWLTSETGAFMTLPCGTAVPVNPILWQVQDMMRQVAADSGLNLAAAVMDLQTGETIGVNGDDPRLPGCVMNFFSLLNITEDLQNGLYPEDWAGDLISQTIYGSNPHTAKELLLMSGNGDASVAVRKVEGIVQRMGLPNTVYDHIPAYGDLFSLYQYPNVTTANDMVRGLGVFYSGGIVDYQWRDYLLQKMEGVKPGLNHLIGSSAGGDAVISHKNGFYDQGIVDNDIGIIRFTRGGVTYAYAISLFSEDIQTEFADIPWLDRIGSLAWQYFSAKYQ